MHSVPPPPPRFTVRTGVVGMVACVVLTCGNAVIQTILTGNPPLIGAPGGEVWGHAWVQWWHTAALPAWPEGPSGWVTGTRAWPVIDPLPTAVAASLASVVGTILAYDLLIGVAVAGAFLGGALLAREQAGDPFVGGLALALAPAWLGSVASGLTEDLAIGLTAIGLGWVGSPDVRRALGAGACLGVLTACGLVLAWTAAVVAVGLGVGALLRSTDRKRTLLHLLGGAGIAGVLALPTVAMHLDRLGGSGHRLGRFVPRPEPLWRLNPWQGADLASFFVPGHVDPADALVRMHPGYLGWSLLALAVVGGRSRWWWVLLGAVLVAPGLHLSVMGEPTGISNPFAIALHALPFGDLLNHHGRLLLVGAVALSVLAARGARVLTARFGRRAWLLVVLGVGLDLALLGPVGAPLPTADPQPLAVYTLPDFATLPAGPVLQLPAAGPGIHFQRPLLDQRVHQRPLMLDPNRPGLPPALARTETGRFLASLAAPDPAPAPKVVEWPGDVSVLVVAEPYVAPVQAALGAPALSSTDSAAWVAPRSLP